MAEQRHRRCLRQMASSCVCQGCLLSHVSFGWHWFHAIKQLKQSFKRGRQHLPRLAPRARRPGGTVHPGNAQGLLGSALPPYQQSAGHRSRSRACAAAQPARRGCHSAITKLRNQGRRRNGRQCPHGGGSRPRKNAPGRLALIAADCGLLGAPTPSSCCRLAAPGAQWSLSARMLLASQLACAKAHSRTLACRHWCR